MPVIERDQVQAEEVQALIGAEGQILFGVEGDGTIVGLGQIDVARACNTILQFVSSRVTPIPDFRVDRIDLERTGRGSETLIVLTVDQGGLPTYGVDPAHPRHFIRRGATTSEASSDQVCALARSRPPSDGAQGSYIPVWG